MILQQSTIKMNLLNKIIQKASPLSKKEKSQIFLTLLLIHFLILILIPSTSADVYVGTTEGYIYNTEGQVVDASDVTVTVNQCIVGCTQSIVSENSGYYVTANLNLPKQGVVTVYAQKMTALGLEFGQANGIANDYQAANVNVVICLPAPQPSLVQEPNTHDTFATLEWASSADLKGYATWDEVRVDSTNYPKNNNPGSKSLDITGLSFSSHTWRVRTCTNFCCSSWVTDTFNVGNTRPNPPTPTPQLDTIPTTIDFTWISGADEDFDETFDEFEYHIIEDNWESTTNAISPISKEVFGCNYYEWRVRTCEKESEQLCSSWATDGFIACGIQCPACTSNCGSGGGDGGGGTTCTAKTKTLVVTNQLTTEQEEAHKLLISFATSGTSDNIWFKVNSSEFDFSDYPITSLIDSKAKFELIGKPKGKVPPGEYNFTLDVFEGNKKTIEEQMTIKVKKPLLINVKRIAQEMPKRKSWWIYSLIVIIILIILYIYLKNRNPSMNQKIKGKVKNTLKKKI